MRKPDIDKAIAEAKRFIERANALIEAQNGTYDCWGHILASKDSGAVRRASMDLTRSLADLRRP